MVIIRVEVRVQVRVKVKATARVDARVTRRVNLKATRVMVRDIVRVRATVKNFPLGMITRIVCAFQTHFFQGAKSLFIAITST